MLPGSIWIGSLHCGFVGFLCANANCISTLINVYTFNVLLFLLTQVWAQLSADYDVIKNAEHSSGQADGAAAEDRGQHWENKGVFTFIVIHTTQSGLLLSYIWHICQGESVCALISLQVSKASSDLMRYCGEHAKNDPLLMGVPASENPFKDKKPCIIL